MSDSQHRVLRSKEGQFVTVRKLRNGLMLLCAIDQQDSQNAPSVHVWKNDKNHLAFKFEQSDGCYSPKVVGTHLELDQIAIRDELTEHHWFEKYNVHSGEHYGLRSVAKPTLYLYVKTAGRKIFSVRQTSQDCVQIRDDEC